jgi:hypothetical protein
MHSLRALLCESDIQEPFRRRTYVSFFELLILLCNRRLVAEAGSSFRSLRQTGGAANAKHG